MLINNIIFIHFFKRSINKIITQVPVVQKTISLTRISENFVDKIIKM